MENKLIDHLFRHQYGKMVSILTRIFGLSYLEIVEDAVQDTFVNAMVKWRNQIPDNPEAWLTAAAKNRALDLLRKVKAENQRFDKLSLEEAESTIDNFFLDHEIEDSQLRMIFTACHTALHPKDQIAFALKTVAGFSTKEIATALLLKDDTVKKRLSRARMTIKERQIDFKLPDKIELLARLERVHEVLYLIFNEGFHSNHNTLLIRKDLCGEAMRLTKLVLHKNELRSGAGYALFALMCFHSSRLESRLSQAQESIDLKNQDRKKWFFPLINLGNEAMQKAVQYDDYSCYHIEASIAVEHLNARSFEETNWSKILELYRKLYAFQEDTFTLLNIAMVLIKLEDYGEAIAILDCLDPTELEQRAYLYYGVKAEYCWGVNRPEQAIEYIEHAMSIAANATEKKYLENKRDRMLEKSKDYE